jgi:hypothetical protein
MPNVLMAPAAGLADLAIVSPFDDSPAPPYQADVSAADVHLSPLAKEPAASPAPSDPWALWDWQGRTGSPQLRSRATADSSTAQAPSRQQADEFFALGAPAAADPLAGLDGASGKTPGQSAGGTSASASSQLAAAPALGSNTVAVSSNRPLGTPAPAALPATLPSASALAAAGSQAANPATSPGQTPDKNTVLQQYGQLGLRFEANQGQADPQVDFLSRGQGYSLFLTGKEAVLNLTRPAVQPAPGGSQMTAGTVLRTQFVGANPNPTVTGLQPLAGTSNYFSGSDPSQWHTNIANYGAVQYQNLYPGIDLVYYGSNQRQLEYDFVVAPGADPSLIKLQIQGADKVGLDPQGDLVLHTGTGDVVEHAPIVYQLAGAARQPVSGRFVLGPNGTVGFAVGAYDPARPLYIDPVLSYSTYLGGSATEQGFGIAVDSSGDAYVTGTTASSNFPTTTGAYQTSNKGTNGGNAFVSKLNSTGTSLVYSTYLGGGSWDKGYAIAVDSSGDAYITGWTNSPTFPTTASAFETGLPSGAMSAAFVTKLSSAGNSLVYSTYLGGNRPYGVNSLGYGIAVDGSGDAFVAGTTNATNFPTTTGVIQPSWGGGAGTPDGYDAFVTKLNSTGSNALYSTYLGGSGEDQANAIALDSSGNAYVTGYTTSTNFPTTTGAYKTTSGGGQDAFVAKLNSGGTALSYSSYLGGSGTDSGNGIAVNSSGNAYVTGSTASTNFPTTTGAYKTTSGGGTDAFVTEMNTSGSAPVYSTYLGGSSDDTGYGIAVDSNGNAYIAGSTGSTNFPTLNAFQTTGGAAPNAFVTKLNAGGAALGYSSYLGGAGTDSAAAVALDASANVYLTGFTGSGFPTTTGAFQTAYGTGSSDAFVTKIS